ncbi:hypothetical protein, partial [Candidatus Magnetobacterium casense]|uniref:hypothetical protein n=1 Tax=Candidatus Magnetobacterium casense TaxID=1455061 RepID=UPI001C44E4DF
FMHHGFLVKPGMTHLENACNCHSCESRNPCPLTVKKFFTLLFKEDTQIVSHLCHNRIHNETDACRDFGFGRILCFKRLQLFVISQFR